MTDTTETTDLAAQRRELAAYLLEAVGRVSDLTLMAESYLADLPGGPDPADLQREGDYRGILTWLEEELEEELGKDYLPFFGPPENWE